jgi:DnaJ like chaperone protein
LKKAYKKLMAQHHPDKLMSQGLPPELMELAKQKTQDIQAAYELIRKHRV